MPIAEQKTPQEKLAVGQNLDEVQTFIGVPDHEQHGYCGKQKSPWECHIWIYAEGYRDLYVLFEKPADGSDQWVVRTWRAYVNEARYVQHLEREERLARARARSACKFSIGMSEAIAKMGGTEAPLSRFLCLFDD